MNEWLTDWQNENGKKSNQLFGWIGKKLIHELTLLFDSTKSKKPNTTTKRSIKMAPKDDEDQETKKRINKLNGSN